MPIKGFSKIYFRLNVQWNLNYAIFTKKKLDKQEDVKKHADFLFCQRRIENGLFLMKKSLHFINVETQKTILPSVKYALSCIVKFTELSRTRRGTVVSVADFE